MKSRNATRYVREASIVMALDDELRQAMDRRDVARAALNGSQYAEAQRALMNAPIVRVRVSVKMCTQCC